MGAQLPVQPPIVEEFTQAQQLYFDFRFRLGWLDHVLGSGNPPNTQELIFQTRAMSQEDISQNVENMRCTLLEMKASLQALKEILS